MNKPVWVIANPESAGGRGARVLPELETALSGQGIEFSLHRTRAPGHARELAKAARDLASGILIVGGDGTVHEVADGLLSKAAESTAAPPLPPIAVLPVGTGNDFFRMVRSSRRVGDVVRVLGEGVPRHFEVGEVRWEEGVRHFVNLIGVGIDVAVLRRRPAFRRLPGLLQYLAALSAALVSFEPIPLRVTVRSGETEELIPEAAVLLSAVTVGPSIGGGFFLSPNAVPDDGLLDLFHVTNLGVLKVLRYLPGILRGVGLERPEITQVQGMHILIERMDGRGLDFELDGELVEVTTSRLDIRVLPSRLQVLELPEEE